MLDNKPAGNSREYNGRRGEGQANGKAQSDGVFLDTPNDPILFCPDA